MPRRRIVFSPAAEVAPEFEAIRQEAGVAVGFAPGVEAEAAAAADVAVGGAERLDVPFVTIDPPGSRDLPGPPPTGRGGPGHGARSAIAAVAGFVPPGGALAAPTHGRGVPVSPPDARAPPPPPVLSEGAASL